MAAHYEGCELLHWFDYVDPTGREWPVFFCDETQFHFIRNCYGLMFKPPGQAVFINIRFPIADQNSTLLHELTHVALTGLRSISADTEERICRRVEDVMTRVSIWSGWRTPKRPDGYAKMRRRAVRNYERENGDS